jgi:hypothetical protein
MENNERAHLKSYYYNELEFVKNKVTQMTNPLEQLLRSNNGGDIYIASCWSINNSCPSYIFALRGRFNNWAVFYPFSPLQPTQALVIVDLTVEVLSDDRSIGPINYDKLSAIEKRLKAVEGSYLFDPLYKQLKYAWCQKTLECRTLCTPN